MKRPHPQDCDCVCCRGSGRIRLIQVNPRAVDRRVIAERKWAAPIQARTAQYACDHGLFSDEMDQIEMFMEPTND
jgi:hypothetical protein